MSGYDVVYIVRGDGALTLQSRHVDTSEEVDTLIAYLADDPALWREWSPLVVSEGGDTIEERDWPRA